jgi:hypothetical protein
VNLVCGSNQQFFITASVLLRSYGMLGRDPGFAISSCGGWWCLGGYKTGLEGLRRLGGSILWLGYKPRKISMLLICVYVEVGGGSS